MKPYNTEATQQVLTPPVVDEGRYKLHTAQAAVGIPFGQAFISGAISGVAVMILAWVADILDPWKPGLVIFALITPAIWFLSRHNWVGLVNRVEAWTGLDIDQDGDVNDEPKPVTNIDLTTSENKGHRRTQRLQVPATEKQLQKLAIGLNGGVNFSEKIWAGQGKPFSIDGFRELRDYLIKTQLLIQKNEKDVRQGYVLTERGRRMLTHYLPYPADEEA